MGNRIESPKGNGPEIEYSGNAIKATGVLATLTLALSGNAEVAFVVALLFSAGNSIAELKKIKREQK